MCIVRCSHANYHTFRELRNFLDNLGLCVCFHKEIPETRNQYVVGNVDRLNHWQHDFEKCRHARKTVLDSGKHSDVDSHSERLFISIRTYNVFCNSIIDNFPRRQENWHNCLNSSICDSIFEDVFICAFPDGYFRGRSNGGSDWSYHPTPHRKADIQPNFVDFFR